MEKLIYVVWKPEEVPIDGFRQDLLGPIARQLIALGADGLA